MPPSDQPSRSTVEQAQRLDELDGAFGESLDGVARLAAGVSDPDVVEHDHVVVGGQVVQEFGIPPVDGPAEPVQQDQRNTSLPTEPPVGEGGGRTAPRKRFRPCLPGMCSRLSAPIGVCIMVVILKYDRNIMD